MGKAYTNKKPVIERPEADNYSTPPSLIWELDKLNIIDKSLPVFDCCSGEGNIIKTLRKLGYNASGKDIRKNKGYDFLKYNKYHPQIVTNFPFSLWDDFLTKSLRCSDKVITIGKTNFFGVHSRNENKFWRHLKAVYVFDRQIDYRTPYRSDGLCNVGNLVTGWFYFDVFYEGIPGIHIIDVQKYAKLGAFEKKLKLEAS